jgi:hypothetical protein
MRFNRDSAVQHDDYMILITLTRQRTQHRTARLLTKKEADLERTGSTASEMHTHHTLLLATRSTPETLLRVQLHMPRPQNKPLKVKPQLAKLQVVTYACA